MRKKISWYLLQIPGSISHIGMEHKVGQTVKTLADKSTASISHIGMELKSIGVADAIA